MKKKLIVALVILGVIVMIGVGFAKWGVGKYNRLIALGQDVDKSWGQVENVLQRRNDLIPNLVNVVQAYAVHEQEVFIKVAEARGIWNRAMQGGTVADKMKADETVRGALFNLMATVERYPDVKANQNFLALQDELAGTENRIVVERMRYNEAIQGYNIFAKMFPNNFIVGMFSFPIERDFFKAAEGAAQAPQVNITYPAQLAQPATPPSALPSAPPSAPQAMPAPEITPPSVPAGQ